MVGASTKHKQRQQHLPLLSSSSRATTRLQQSSLSSPHMNTRPIAGPSWILILILLKTLRLGLAFSNFATSSPPPSSRSSSSSSINMQKDENPERPSRFYPAFVESLPSMQGKTVVITGCSRGLGYVTARTIVKCGGFVIMMNRKSETANQVLQELTDEATTTVPPVLVECDLLSFDSVRQACEQVRQLTKETGIDVLCCNAGIMLQPNQASQDGYDITASTNVLSHFLMTKLLFPQLQQAAAEESKGEARIVSMSSLSGYGEPGLDPSFFEQRGGKMGDSGQAKYERYHQSKLANLLFTSVLDDKLKGTSRVKAVACTPGVCGTDMFLHATTVMSGRPSSRSNVPSTEDGAMAQLKCICDPTVDSGDLWGPKMGTGTLVKTDLAPPQIMIDANSKERFWKACEKAIGEAFEF